MNSKTRIIVCVALGLIALCAFFPPRRPLGDRGPASRGCLLDPEIDEAYAPGSFGRQGRSFVWATVDGARLAAECIFILAGAGLVAVLVNNKPKQS
jgi:hypothetical protein